mgnify:CR=1 FL=1
MTSIYRNIYNILVFVMLLLLAASCRDDSLFPDDPDLEGSTTVELQFDFTPYAERQVRSFIDNPSGKTMAGIDDLAVLVYDKEGNLIPEMSMNLTAADLNVRDVPREDSDASNNKAAESETARGTFKMDIEYGQYYIYGLANIGRYAKDGTTRLTTSLQELERNHKEAIQTVEGLLKIQVEWDEDVLGNNKQMLGVFTDGRGDAPSTPDNSNLDSNPNYRRIAINRPGMTCHTWLRRCASKITIDFDGSNLLENTRVYFKQATVHDISKYCYLGTRNRIENANGMITNRKGGYTSDPGDPNDEYDPNNPKVHPNYRPVGGTRILYSNEADETKWPWVSKGHKYGKYYDSVRGDSVEFHAESAPGLYLYENMQGDGVEGVNDKEMNPEDWPSDNVDKADELKDQMEFGSYIEVEGYYDYHTSQHVSKGKIYYRFMLGKDTKINFDTERNYHYKLTLMPRGMGNDYDWHIEYVEKDRFDVRDPYFVSYLYNHSSTIPFKYTPSGEFKGAEVYRLHAEIVGNNWWPDGLTDYAPTAVSQQVQRASGAFSHDVDNDDFYRKDGAQQRYLGNGFLSLRETKDMNITTTQAGGVNMDAWNWYATESNKWVNDAYFYGKRSGSGSIDRSQRWYYFDGTEDNTKTGMEDYARIYDERTGAYEFNIPMFTRAKNLVKKTSYTGNNPFIAHTRSAFIRLTVYMRDRNTKQHLGTDKTIVRVEQVKRVVNPKGIYRKAGNNEPFHVRLMDLDSDEDIKFNVISSRGPWMAEVMGADDFIKLNGRHKVIHGATDTDIDFVVNFNKMNVASDKTVRNAVIRVRYNNYTCVHLIFVRQGYEPQEVGGINWRISNLRHPDLADKDFDPRDEGSMFKRNHLTQPIHPVCNVYNNSSAFPASFPSSVQKVTIAKSDGTPGNSINWNAEGFDGSGNFNTTLNMVTMKEYSDFYMNPNIKFGFGVLYADGATETAEMVDDAYGYYYGDSDCGKRGMRGLFAYHWNPGAIGFDNDKNNGKSIFFPIGRSGYGHRKTQDLINNGGILRYSCIRTSFFDEFAATPYYRVPWMPLFWDIFKRPGAIYWAKNVDISANIYDVNTGAPVNVTAEGQPGALDINFFSYDVNFIGLGNIFKSGQSSQSDACFIRLKQ